METLLPGTRLLRRYLRENNISRAEFARRASKESGTNVDRVTIANIANGHATRISVSIARAIALGSEGAVPIESFDPTWDGDAPDEPTDGEHTASDFHASGTEG
jgi:transcriptional regulator with XRE-family HTH domain